MEMCLGIANVRDVGDRLEFIMPRTAWDLFHILLGTEIRDGNALRKGGGGGGGFCYQTFLTAETKRFDEYWRTS